MQGVLEISVEATRPSVNGNGNLMVSTKILLVVSSVRLWLRWMVTKCFTLCTKSFPLGVIKQKVSNSPNSAIVLSNRTDMPKGA